MFKENDRAETFFMLVDGEVNLLFENTDGVNTINRNADENERIPFLVAQDKTKEFDKLLGQSKNMTKVAYNYYLWKNAIHLVLGIIDPKANIDNYLVEIATNTDLALPSLSE